MVHSTERPSSLGNVTIVVFAISVVFSYLSDVNVIITPDECENKSSREKKSFH